MCYSLMINWVFSNAACGDVKRRVRRWPFPRAAIAIPACGVFNISFFCSQMRLVIYMISVVKGSQRTGIRSTDAKGLCNGGRHVVDRDGNAHLLRHDVSS